MHNVVYKTGWDRPLVEVLIDGVWYPGELRMWTQHDDQGWTANVSWTSKPGSTFLTTVPAEQVRHCPEG